MKRYENGFILNPMCMAPTNTVGDVLKAREDVCQSITTVHCSHSKLGPLGMQHGFSGFPVTEDGKLQSRLLGIVTNRDVDFRE